MIMAAHHGVRLQDGGPKERRGRWYSKKCPNHVGTTALASEGDFGSASTKCGNDFLQELKRSDNIFDSEVGLSTGSHKSELD